MLGLPASTCDEEDVRAAFRRLAKLYHPDVAGTGDAVRFQAVQQAAQQLLAASGAAQDAALASVSIWEQTAPISRTSASARAPPSSAARPLEMDAFAASRGMRVDTQASVARRRRDLRKAQKLKTLTHKATPQTVQRVQGVLARIVNPPAALLHPAVPLASVGFVLELKCVGLQHVADIMLALEEEFGVELFKVLVRTWMKLDLPDHAATIQGLADYVESKVASAE